MVILSKDTKMGKRWCMGLRMPHSYIQKKALAAIAFCLYFCIGSGIAFSDEGTLHTGKKPQKTMSFSTAAPVSLDLYEVYESLYREAFKRMGYRFQLQYHPDLRAVIQADSGRTDGTCGRVFEFIADGTYQNLIRVDEAIVSVRLVAWALRKNIGINGWESLKNHKIVYTKGGKIIEINLPKFVPKANIILASTIEQALKLLEAGRVDIFLEVDAIGSYIENHPGFRDKGFTIAGDVARLKFYPYLNRKHAILAPKLAETLKAMKEDGIYYKIVSPVYAAD